MEDVRAVSVDQEAVVVIFIVDVAADVAAAFDDQNALAKLRRWRARPAYSRPASGADDEPIYSHGVFFGKPRCSEAIASGGVAGLGSPFLNAAKMLADRFGPLRTSISAAG